MHNPTPNYRVALFDFDGTICDDFHAAILILNNLADDFGFMKVDLGNLEQVRDMGTRKLMQTLGISLHKLPFIVKKARKSLQEKIRDLYPVQGIPEVIDQLSRQKIRLGIITSNSESNVRFFLEKNGIDQFQFISTGGSIFGKARLINRLLKAQGMESQSVVYIGDETRDIEAARRAKVKIVSVSWGFNSKNALELERPDYLIHQPRNLLEIFRL